MAAPRRCMSMENHGGMVLKWETGRTPRKACPSATTDPTWTNPGLRGERPATNRLSHGTTLLPAFVRRTL
jgi:hypothetical protein